MPRLRSGARLCAVLTFLLLWAHPGLPGFPTPCAAQEVSAWVDKNTATLEDQIVLTVSVSGFRRFEGSPLLPPLPDFTVTQGGTTSRTQIINGRFTSSLECTYLLTPSRAGVFTIGPVRVEVRGEVYQSQPLQLKILPPESAAEESPPVYVTQEVDVPNPYVQQQLVYRFRFLQKVQTLEAQWEPPVFQGFWVEDLGKENRYETVLGGQRYSVTEIKKALFPTSAGVLTIPESTLTCKMLTSRRGSGYRRGFEDDFFSPLFGRTTQAVTKSLRSKPIRVEVRALPSEGRPPDFLGLVGSFTVNAAVGERELRTGDSTTLTVTVSGEGNLRDLVSLPPEEIRGFKIYPDKPSFELTPRGDLVKSTRVFKKALVPLQTGALEIPAIRIAYFDPGASVYRLAETGPIRLSVLKGEQPEPLNLVQSPLLAGGKNPIQVLGKDILPIHTGLAGADRHLPAGSGLGLYLSAALLPPGAFLVVFGLQRRRKQRIGDPRLVRRKEARRKAERELKQAKRLAGQPEGKEFHRQLARGLKGLIGDKLNLSALAFTPVEISRCLEQKGLPEELTREVHRFLEELEFRQYASARDGAEDPEALFRRAREFLAQLDRKL